MLIIAHRGASGTYLENSYEAFQAAYEMGAQAIETDVRRCQICGELALSHEPILTKEQHESSMRFWDVLYFGEWMSLHLEIKERKIWREILKITENLRFRHCIVYSSFLWWELAKLKFTNPGSRIGLLLGTESKNLPLWAVILFGKILGAESIHMDFALVDANKVRRLRRNGFLVYAHTLNRSEEIYMAWQLRLDGIFTDYPAYAGEIIAESQNIVIQ